MSTEALQDIRDRLRPMLDVAVEQYRNRVPRGYPNVIDTPDRGLVGLEIDNNHALFITDEGGELHADYQIADGAEQAATVAGGVCGEDAANSGFG